MGACCKLFARKQLPPSEENSNKKELIPVGQPLTVNRHTANDAHFTYFLEVFELSSCGATLKLPQFADENHPRFSYQQFHKVHREYYRLVKELGLYVQRRKQSAESLHQRIIKDQAKIRQAQKRGAEGRGCLVKLEVQGAVGTGVQEIVITHNHPQGSKFRQTIPLNSLRAKPSFFEFVAPHVAQSSLQIVGKPKGLQTQISLQSNLQAGKTVFCEVLEWSGEKGVAIRLQLYDGRDEQERLKEMGELYAALMKQFQNEGEEREPTRQEIEQRVSRHRSSLSQHYNLNNNSMF